MHIYIQWMYEHVFFNKAIYTYDKPIRLWLNDWMIEHTHTQIGSMGPWWSMGTQRWVPMYSVACSSCIFCACICSSFKGQTTAASGSFLSLVHLIPYDPQIHPITIIRYSTQTRATSIFGLNYQCLNFEDQTWSKWVYTPSRMFHKCPKSWGPRVSNVEPFAISQKQQIWAGHGNGGKYKKNLHQSCYPYFDIF